MAALLCNYRYVRSSLASNAFAGQINNQRFTKDVQFGGDYRIAGIVTEIGVPGSYRVRLFDRMTGMLVRETWSASTGEYAFNNITPTPNQSVTNGYFVVAFDHGDNPLNAAIADLVTSEPMP